MDVCAVSCTPELSCAYPVGLKSVAQQTPDLPTTARTPGDVVDSRPGKAGLQMNQGSFVMLDHEVSEN